MRSGGNGQTRVWHRSHQNSGKIHRVNVDTFFTTLAPECKKFRVPSASDDEKPGVNSIIHARSRCLREVFKNVNGPLLKTLGSFRALGWKLERETGLSPG
jgi:hypothetical protein